MAEPGAFHVVTLGRDSTKNLRTHLMRIIRRAGLTPWPRLFQNLRASRETELAEQCPLRVVTDWLGNSPNVALDHYLSTTEDHFKPRCGGQPNQALAKSDAARRPQTIRTVSQTDGDDAEVLERPASCDVMREGARECEFDMPNERQQSKGRPGWTRTTGFPHVEGLSWPLNDGTNQHPDQELNPERLVRGEA